MRANGPEASNSDFVDAVARRVIELLREEQLPHDVPRLLTAAQVAKRFGVSTDWVYANASALGAIRMGSGPRARLRFDRTAIENRFAGLGGRHPRPDGRDRKATPAQTADEDGLLPILGRGS
jgi:hypothetical protein